MYNNIFVFIVTYMQQIILNLFLQRKGLTEEKVGKAHKSHKVAL